MKSSIKQNRLKYLYAVFTENPLRASYYDISGSREKFPFTWFKISIPQNKFLINQGADRVAESYQGGKKILFTGMRRAWLTLWWVGNIFDNNKRNLILFRFHKENRSFDVYLFMGFYPASEMKRNEFIRLFMHTKENEMSETHAPDTSYVQSNTDNPDVCATKIPN